MARPSIDRFQNQDISGSPESALTLSLTGRFGEVLRLARLRQGRLLRVLAEDECQMRCPSITDLVMKLSCNERVKSCRYIRTLKYAYMPKSKVSFWQWTDIRGFSRMETQPDYTSWTNDELLERVRYLERQLQSQKAK